MENQFKDINKLPTDGYLIFPLSMSRLQHGQSPKECIHHLEMLDKKVNIPGIDVIFLYTNGLYFNTKNQSFSMRKKTNSQMLAHRNSLKKLIINRKKIPKYIPSAFHFLPFDYIMLNSDEYQKHFEILLKEFKKNNGFKKAIHKSLKGRAKNEANTNFIFEEVVISHLIRQNMIEFPKTLVKKDTFRLIIYPDHYLEADVYVWKNKLLPLNKSKKQNKYSRCIYNPNTKELYDFDDIIL